MLSSPHLAVVLPSLNMQIVPTEGRGVGCHGRKWAWQHWTHQL